MRRFVCCRKCFDTAEEEETNRLEFCQDCKESKKSKEVYEWRWYDFYAAQGDEPLRICKDCWDNPKHKNRSGTPQYKVEVTMGDDTIIIAHVIPASDGVRMSRQGWGVVIPEELGEELYPYVNQIAKYLEFNVGDIKDILRRIQGNLKISIALDDKSEQRTQSATTKDFRIPQKGLAGAWRRWRDKSKAPGFKTGPQDAWGRSWGPDGPPSW